MSATKGRNREDTNRGRCLSIALHPNEWMTVNRPWTCSPTTAISATAAISADNNCNNSNAPFARAPEADRNCRPGYSWLPHLYQEESRIEEQWNCVNKTLQNQTIDEETRAPPAVALANRLATTRSSRSGIPGGGTPLVGDGLKKVFRIEHFTWWERKFRPNLLGDLICHVKAHVARKRTPPVQERLDQRKLLRGKPLRSISGGRRRLPGHGRRRRRR